MNVENVLHVDFEGIGRVAVDSGTYTPAGREHSLESGEEGDVGFGAKHRSAKLDVSIFKTANIKLQTINDFRGAIMVQTDEGSTYLMTDARCVGAPSLSTGRIAATFHSISAREVQ
jgi:hypothetical protein